MSKIDQITLIGFGQLNATIFFITRYTTLHPYFPNVDLIIAAMFLIRTLFFFNLFLDPNNIKKRQAYFLAVNITLIVIVILALVPMILKWIEWGNLEKYPPHITLSWVAWGAV